MGRILKRQSIFLKFRKITKKNPFKSLSRKKAVINFRKILRHWFRKTTQINKNSKVKLFKYIRKINKV